MQRPGYSQNHRRRGLTLYAVILTLAILAILSYNLVHQALMDYRQGAMVRDTIALQHLTDSALRQAVYHLNRNEPQAAQATVRESFGVARIEIDESEDAMTVRIAAHAPGESMPRMASRTRFRLERDAEGRWRVVAAVAEAVPVGQVE